MPNAADRSPETRSSHRLPITTQVWLATHLLARSLLASHSNLEKYIQENPALKLKAVLSVGFTRLIDQGHCLCLVVGGLLSTKCTVLFIGLVF